MEPRLPASLSDLLEYLEGIGYRDLYLRASENVAKATAPGRPAPQQGPASARSAAPSSPPAQVPRPSRPRDEPPRRIDRGPSPPAPKVEIGPLLDGPPPEDLGSRVQVLATLARRASTCEACGLCRGRRTVVFGTGHPQADLMFIGEGPGAEEDRRGLPFVGPAGELLNKIIGAIGQRRESVYIANVVKCRPPNNRDPLPDEVAACRAYLEAQIDIVRPKVLVMLGRVATQALLQSSGSLGSLRGRWHEVRGVPTRATYHPAALLRNSSWKRPTWEDMQIVRDKLLELQEQ